MDIKTQAKNNLLHRLVRILDNDMVYISSSPLLTIDFVEAHPDWKWNMEGLSFNPSLTMKFVEEHPDWKWNIYFMSENTSLTMEFLESHQDWKWEMYPLSGNPSLTMEFIEAHPDWEWDITHMLSNPSITVDFLGARPDWKISISNTSKAVEKKYIVQLYDVPLTMEFIEAHPRRRWDKMTISMNPFDLDVKKEIARLVTEHLSALKIQHWFDDVAHWNPEFERSSKNVRNSFEEIYNKARDISCDRILRTPR